MARKGLYSDWLEPEKLELVAGWARDGLTEKQIADNMGISLRTFCTWKKQFPQFLQLLKKNKAVADYQTENSLYKSAIGYYVDEEVTDIIDDNVVAIRRTHKWIAPNVTAQIFWLKNRCPEKWRDKRDVGADVSADIGGIVFIPSRDDFTPPS